MRLERVRRWHWVVLSLVVGLGLAQARRFDGEDLPNQLGEGVADRGWFEREVQRRVQLADGTTVPAFGRLRVYPLSVRERGGRRQVHLVAGMYLAHAGDGQGAPGGAAAVGKLRPYFFIAPVPYQSLGEGRAGKPVAAGATVREYLDGLRGKGVTYTYAWWADPRYAAAAWVGGSLMLIGVLWPTALNLLAYGTFRAPREEKGVSLWKVRPAHSPPRKPVNVTAVAGAPVAADHVPVSTTPSPSFNPSVPPAASATVRVLSVARAEGDVAAAVPEHEHKEFGAKRDDYYPTELKAAARRSDHVHG